MPFDPREAQNQGGPGQAQRPGQGDAQSMWNQRPGQQQFPGVGGPMESKGPQPQGTPNPFGASSPFGNSLGGAGNASPMDKLQKNKDSVYDEWMKELMGEREQGRGRLKGELEANSAAMMRGSASKGARMGATGGTSFGLQRQAHMGALSAMGGALGQYDTQTSQMADRWRGREAGGYEQEQAQNFEETMTQQGYDREDAAGYQNQVEQFTEMAALGEGRQPTRNQIEGTFPQRDDESDEEYRKRMDQIAWAAATAASQAKG